MPRLTLATQASRIWFKPIEMYFKLVNSLFISIDLDKAT